MQFESGSAAQTLFHPPRGGDARASRSPTSKRAFGAPNSRSLAPQADCRSYTHSQRMPQESRIRILDEEVASQIAAGEVVERPASVVKELLENAVDAGATRITVDIAGGGRELIRVADNGCGMTAQEAVLSLQRHATSKIRRPEDLVAIRTLGFRGEALPSVASVSRLSLVTRARGELEGVRLEVEAGEIRTLEPAGAAEGTTVTVTDLFYNTPARRKFLKTDRTELGQIGDVVSRVALSHPGLSVRLAAEGGELLHAPGSPEPLNTVAALYGNELARKLLSVSHHRSGAIVEGFISRPTWTRPTRSAQQFFVNGRWIRSRTLSHALDAAFRGALPAGRFPFALLYVEIDPAVVDVNVHPTKAEVRFLRDWEVHRLVQEAVEAALAGTAAPRAPVRQELLDAADLVHAAWLPAAPSTVPPAARAPHPPADSAPAGQPALPALHAPLRGLRPVAQLWDSYILAEGAEGLLIIDQHLAHERVLFDRYRAGDPAPGRPLDAPVTLQLSHREALAADERLPELTRLGFTLEPFGRDAFVVRSVPEGVADGAEEAVLRRVLEELAGRGPADEDRAAAATACRAAVRKGVPLGREEIVRLLHDLERVANPHTCPHGCPIAVELSFQELLKRFKRT